MDKRQIKTRKAIIAAFVKLMKKQPYEEVTVKDIIEAAEIGRSTFYSHFETKEDLAKQMCYDLYKHIFAEHVRICSTHNYSQQPPTLETRLAHIFYHIRDHRDYYDGILKVQDGKLFTEFFHKYMQENVAIRVISLLSLKVPADFFANHITYAFIGALRWWLQNDMAIPPEELAVYLKETINPNNIELVPKPAKK